MEPEIFRLFLTSSLFYTPCDVPDPFAYGGGTGGFPGEETLFCFDLDEAVYRSIEPDEKKLIKKLVFGGKSAGVPGTGSLELPGGNYFFAQKRGKINKEEILSLAVEIQQEVLWQRLEPGKRLYLRYLFEDGSMVTQLFRPYTG